MKQRSLVVLFLVTLAAQSNLAQAPESSLPIAIDVPAAPIPVRGAGASHLFYEIHLTNFRAVPLELTRVEVPLTEKRAVPITLDTLGGNLVVVDIGNGRCATFAHLIPKSLRVSVGAKVRRGQVLGLLGNSGNSDAPHLHFHIADGPSAMGSEGVPYIFESMQFRGSVASLDKLVADEPWIPQGGTVVRTREIPMDNAVIRVR